MADSSISKEAIAMSFGKAAAHYDAVAHFQRWAGEASLSRIPPQCHGQVLDLGTGTGHFLSSLVSHADVDGLVALDLAQGMIDYAREQKGDLSHYLVADADYLPFRNHSFDLIFSSLSIQWCFDLEHLFGELARVMRPGGYFVFSTLLEGSLFELGRSWQVVDQKQHVNDFFGIDSYCSAIERAGLDILSLEDVPEVLWYDNVMDLMRELKTLGAHNMTKHRAKSLTGKSRLHALIDAYEQFRSPEGALPATYRVGFGVLVNR